MKALRFTEDEFRDYVSRRGKKEVIEFNTLGNDSRLKYRNKPTTIDGHRFPSKKEARRYVALKLLERAGEIGTLALQVRYPLTVNGIKVATYVADFVYEERRSEIYPDMSAPQQVVEDCKGFRTPLYKLKKLLMFAIHGIKIIET